MQICSRVRRENIDSALEVSNMDTTTGPLESTTCPVNQSRYIHRLEMLLIDAQSTIDILAVKKKKDFSGGRLNLVSTNHLRKKESAIRR